MFYFQIETPGNKLIVEYKKRCEKTQDKDHGQVILQVTDWIQIMKILFLLKRNLTKSDEQYVEHEKKEKGKQ